MDAVSIGKMLLEWALKRGEAKGRSNDAEIDGFITDLQAACRDLARMEDPRCDEAVLLHERLKQMYDVFFTRLPDGFLEEHAGDLYRAVSSARIYYWLRIVSAGGDAELQRLLSDRKQKSSSFERLGSMLRQAPEGGDGRLVLDPEAVARIREECLRDVERLSLIRPRKRG